MIFARKTSKNTAKRRGGMAVEFALTAPIFFLMMFGGVEFARMHMIQCAIENAAFEGARRGIIPGATSSECKSVTEELLNQARISNHAVTVTPSFIDASTDSIQIDIEIPIDSSNGFGVICFMKNRKMRKSVELPREQAQISEGQ